MKLRMSRIERLMDFDRVIDAVGCLVGSLGHQLEHVLERQADRVDRLDDPVVKVASDPLALLDDGQPPACPWSRALSMAIQAWRAKISTRRWSAGENSARADLVGQVEVADRRPLAVIGTPRNDVIGGWFGGKPYESGCAAIDGIR